MYYRFDPCQLYLNRIPTRTSLVSFFLNWPILHMTNDQHNGSCNFRRCQLENAMGLIQTKNDDQILNISLKQIRNGAEQLILRKTSNSVDGYGSSTLGCLLMAGRKWLGKFLEGNFVSRVTGLDLQPELVYLSEWITTARL
ncbi:Interleukin-21 [Dirofilaria immitis]